MPIDPRLNDIDDCLYRVAARVLIVQNDKVLLVQENEQWWAFPGGGIDHGETAESSLTREIEEELGVPAAQVTSNFQIAHYNIGNVVNGVPRMNLFYKASVPEKLLGQTDHVAKWGWFTRDQFLKLDIHPSYNKTEMVGVIFGSEA